MAKDGKKTIEELRREQKDKILNRKDMNTITGGKRRTSWVRRTFGGIMPQ